MKEAGIPEDCESCGTINLQRERWPNKVWILHGNQIVGKCYESGGNDLRIQNLAAYWYDDMKYGFMKGKGTTGAIFM